MKTNQQTELGLGISCVPLDYESIWIRWPIYILYFWRLVSVWWCGSSWGREHWGDFLTPTFDPSLLQRLKNPIFKEFLCWALPAAQNLSDAGECSLACNIYIKIIYWSHTIIIIIFHVYSHQQYIYNTIFWAAVLSGGVLGCDTEIENSEALGTIWCPQWRFCCRRRGGRNEKSVLRLLCSILGAGISLGGFSPQEKGILCWSTSSKCNILKMQVCSFASICLRRVGVRLGWPPHVTNFRFLRVFAEWASPSFLKKLLCSLVFACLDPEAQS